MQYKNLDKALLFSRSQVFQESLTDYVDRPTTTPPPPPPLISHPVFYLDFDFKTKNVSLNICFLFLLLLLLLLFHFVYIMFFVLFYLFNNCVIFC